MIKRINGNNFVEWCVSVVNSDEYVILDSETTGLSKADQIIELAIINTRGMVLYDQILQPSCPISEGAMAIHRITEEITSSARCFHEEWPEIERAIAGRSIITYNADFDRRMLRQTVIAHNVQLPAWTWYCAMMGYSEHYRLQKWAKLTEACADLGIEFDQQHRALGDVQATLSLIRKVAELGNEAPTYSPG